MKLHMFIGIDTWNMRTEDHRPKVKVTGGKNRLFIQTCYIQLICHAMGSASCNDAISCAYLKHCGRGGGGRGGVTQRRDDVKSIVSPGWSGG